MRSKRLSMLVGWYRHRWVEVLGTCAPCDAARTHLMDRILNRESFVGEHVVRLPRALSRWRSL